MSVTFNPFTGEPDFTGSGGGGAVDSVNAQTGIVVLDADDISDTTTTNKYVTAAEKTKLSNTSGTNSGDNATNTQYSGLAASKQDTLVSGTNIKTVNSTSLLGAGNIVITGGSGDVVGPASSTDNAVARFDSTTGKLLQNSLTTISDTGVISTRATTGVGITQQTSNGTNVAAFTNLGLDTTIGSIGGIQLYKGASIAGSVGLTAGNALAFATSIGTVSFAPGGSDSVLFATAFEPDTSLTFTPTIAPEPYLIEVNDFTNNNIRFLANTVILPKTTHTSALVSTTTAGNGLGYANALGTGGTVTQITSRTTSVTLNRLAGTITMFSAAQAADALVTFTFTNSMIAATDMVIVQHNSATDGGAWNVSVVPAAGSATINIRNVSNASVTSATPLRFLVIKSATS